MNFLVQWGKNPWGEDILTHAQFGLLYLALAFGICFMIGHTLFVKFWPKPAGPQTPSVNDALAAERPPRVPRHSLAPPAVPWIIAAAVPTVLVTALVPVLWVEVDLGPIS